MTISTMTMKTCPFCKSDDVDPQAWASQKEQGGPIVHGPGCMDCGATAETVDLWNGHDGTSTVEVEYRDDLAMFAPTP